MGFNLKCEYCGNETRLEYIEYSDVLARIRNMEFIVTDTNKMIVLTCTKCNEETDIHIK